MSDMRLIVAGAGGRMGRALTRVISETPGAVLAGALEAPGSQLLGKDAGVLAGLPANDVKLSADLWSMSADADGILDFTVPAATIANVAIAAQRGLVHIIGTTGLSGSDDAVIKSVTGRAIVVKSGNMSLGVNLLAALVRRVAQSLDEGFDIEILEMHHRAKIDAPSGTALMLGQAAAAGRKVALDQHSARGRDGITGARRTGDIGFASLRGGTVTGDHTVIFAGPMERIELTHRAEDRTMFAQGAVKAALWARDKKPGMYSMADVLGLVRHGQSEWNLKNLFTGWKDPDLTEKGIAEARDAGQKLKAQGLSFDIAFTSVLKRAQHTLDLALVEIGQTGLPVRKHLALNERDYGDLSGLNKDDARKKWGEEQVHVWRRSYDVSPPGGESLKDTLARTLPYYVQEILPCVLRGERTLVAAHGNSLRAPEFPWAKVFPAP